MNGKAMVCKAMAKVELAKTPSTGGEIPPATHLANQPINHTTNPIITNRTPSIQFYNQSENQVTERVPILQTINTAGDKRGENDLN
jgi:hypothetical protein